MRGKSDTNDGSPQKGNAAKKKRGKSGAGHKAAGKRTVSTGTGDDADYDDEEERRGKNDTEDEAEYDDEDDVLPVTDVPFGSIQPQLWQRTGLSSCKGIFRINQPT